MQFPERIRADLQKNGLFSFPTGPSVGRIRYSLQPSTYDPSKYRCNFPTGYVRGFKKWICISHRRWRMMGVCDTPLRPNTCDPSKNCSVFVPYGAVGWAYAIRPYNRVRVILRNTNAISQLGTCAPSKTVSFPSPSGPPGGRMRYAPTIGYV